MDADLRSEVRALRRLMIVSALCVGLVSLAAFARAGQRERFGEIDVERINVVEKDGTRRLIISNRERSPAVFSHGNVRGTPGRRAGLVFYSDQGDEVGGLVFGGGLESTGKVNQGLSLTFDQYDQDQVVALQHIDEQGSRYQGLTINDRPEVSLGDAIARDEAIKRMAAGPAQDSARAAWLAWQGGTAWGARRLFAGRRQDKSAVLSLADRSGKTRLRLIVDSLGTPRIEFIDTAGHISRTLSGATN